MPGLIFSIKDTLRQGVEAASGGLCTIMYDDKGHPSLMRRIPSFDVSAVASGGIGSGPHPAFIVNGQPKAEVWVGVHKAFIHDGRALSLPSKQPARVNYTDAQAACVSKGPGWHLMTNAEWAAIALLTHTAGTMPHGANTTGGVYSEAPHETGTPVPGGAVGEILTGSGPVTWRHDGTPFGIDDMAGNIPEVVGGVQIIEGEIQVFPNNDAADNTKDQTVGSSEWKGILEAGTLVAPGTASTLKYDHTSDPGTSGTTAMQLDDVLDWQGAGTAEAQQDFETFAADAPIVPPDFLMQMGLFPADTGLGGDRFFGKNYGSRVIRRGGGISPAFTTHAGVFMMDFRFLHTDLHSFRPCYVTP